MASPHDGAANSGGIFTLGELTVRNSVISENSAELESSAPLTVEQASLGGGILVQLCPVEFCGPPNQTTITNTIVRGNRATTRNVNVAGLALAFAGGIAAEGPFLLERSIVSDNVVRAVSAADAAADGGGLEVTGEATIRDTLIAHNSVVAEAVRAALCVRRGDRELRTADPGANARARATASARQARAASCRSGSPPPRSGVGSGMAASAARRLRS